MRSSLSWTNPHCLWLSSGMKWICNLCQLTNDCPQWYRKNLDGQYQRRDRKTEQSSQWRRKDPGADSEFEEQIRRHSVCDAVFDCVWQSVYTSAMLSLPIVRRIADVFRCVDMDTVSPVSSTMTVSAARKSLVNACVDILFVYRRYCASNNVCVPSHRFYSYNI